MSRVEYWLTTSDLNTQYFHLSTAIRQRHNNVDTIKCADGTWVNDRTGIGDQFCNFFSEFVCLLDQPLIRFYMNSYL